MWLFTRNGFYSVTSANAGSGMIQIRARNRTHLQNLQNIVPELREKTILEGTRTDYRWRIFITPQEWETAAVVLAKEALTYRNFKGECHYQANRLELDQRYVELLHRVWSQHYGYQQQQQPFREKEGGRAPLFDEQDPETEDDEIDDIEFDDLEEEEMEDECKKHPEENQRNKNDERPEQLPASQSKPDYSGGIRREVGEGPASIRHLRVR